MIDRCVVCGEIVPEGRQVCPVCENSGEKELYNYYLSLSLSIKREYDRIPAWEHAEYVLELSPYDYGILRMYAHAEPTPENVAKATFTGMEVEIVKHLPKATFRMAHKVKMYLLNPEWR